MAFVFALVSCLPSPWSPFCTCGPPTFPYLVPQSFFCHMFTLNLWHVALFIWNLLSSFCGKNGGEQWGDTLTTPTTTTTPSIVYKLKPIPIWIYQITKVFPKNQVKLSLSVMVEAPQLSQCTYKNMLQRFLSRFYLSNSTCSLFYLPSNDMLDSF